MTQPLALILYEKLLPGSQLINRLQDLNYRVQHLPEPASLVETAIASKPMLVLAHLESSRKDVCAALGQLKQNPATRHLPIIAFSSNPEDELQKAASAAGATLVVSDSAILNHLSQCLDQALQIE